MTKTIRLLVAVLSISLLGGCGTMFELHPTTESRSLSAAEQEFWSNKEGRQQKSEEWSAELKRQSATRMARMYDYLFGAGNY